MTKGSIWSKGARAVAMAALLAGGVVAAPAAFVGVDVAKAQGSLQKAERLLSLVLDGGLIAQMMEGMNPLMLQQVEQVAAQSNLTLDDAAKQQVIDISTEETLAMFDAARPELAQLYAQTLTEPELDAILTLYESPEGRSAMAKMEQLSGGVAAVLGPRMGSVAASVQRRIETEVLPQLK